MQSNHRRRPPQPELHIDPLVGWSRRPRARWEMIDIALAAFVALNLLVVLAVSYTTLH